MQSSFGFPFAAPRDLPIIFDRNAVAFSATAIEARAVFLAVRFGTAAVEFSEFKLGKISEAVTLAAGAHRDALHPRAIKLQAPLRRGLVSQYIRFRAHH